MISCFLVLKLPVCGSHHRHIYIDASLSAGLYVDVTAIFEEADPPCELIRVNEVKFIKLLLQSAIS